MSIPAASTVMPQVLGTQPASSVMSSTFQSNGPLSFMNGLPATQVVDMMWGRPQVDRLSNDFEEFPREIRLDAFARMWEGKSTRINSILQRVVGALDMPMTRRFGMHKMPEGQLTVFRMLFGDHQLDHVPELGTVNLVSNSWEAWTATRERKGLGFLASDLFALTPIGFETYGRTLLQLANAVSDHCELAAYHEMLSVRGQVSLGQHSVVGFQNVNTYAEAFEQDTKWWSILTKSTTGMNDFMVKVNTTLSLMGQKDSKIVTLPCNTKITMNLSRVNSGYLHNNITGAAGVRTATNPLSDKLMETYSGYEIEESTLFPIGPRGSLVDPLHSARQIGEFFRFEHALAVAGTPASYYSHALRGVNVYVGDDVDKVMTAPWSACFKNCGLFNRDGSISVLGQKFFAGCTIANMYTYMATMGRSRESSEDFIKYFKECAATTVGNTTKATRLSEGVAAVLNGVDAAANVGGRTQRGGGRNNGGSNVLGSGETSAAAAPGTSARPNRYNANVSQYDSEIVTPATRQKYADAAAKDEKTPASFKVLLNKQMNNERITKQDYLDVLADLRAVQTPRTTPWVQILRTLYATADMHHAQLIAFGARSDADNDQLREFREILFSGAAAPTRSTRGVHDRAIYEAGSNPASSAQLKAFMAEAKAFPNVERNMGQIYASVMLQLAQGDSGDAEMRTARRNFIALDTYFAQKPKFERDQQTVLVNRFIERVRFTSDIAGIAQAFSTADLSNALTTSLSEQEIDTLSASFSIAGMRNDTIDSKYGNDTSDVVDTLKRLPVVAQSFALLASLDLPVPLDFAAIRPFQRYIMGNALVFPPDVGKTYIGNDDFQLTNDGARKQMHGNFTADFSTILYRPEAVLVAHNVIPVAYAGGEGFKFFDPLNAQHVNQFQAGELGGRSVFVVPRQPGDGFSMDQFDITGTFPPMFADRPDETSLSGPHLQILPALAQHWGWHWRTEYFEAGKAPAHLQHNTAVLQAHQSSPRVTVGGIMQRVGTIIPGKSHWGNKAYTGCKQHRLGQDGGIVPPSFIAQAQEPVGEIEY